MTERFKLVNKSRINNNRVRLIKTGNSTSQVDPLFGAIYENESEIGLCLSPSTIISCVGAKVESEEIVLDGASWAVEIDGVVVELPSTFAITSSTTVTYEAMVTLLEEHGIRVTELKNAVVQPIYCDGAVSTESCKMQDGGWMLEVDGVDMGGPYDLASLDEYSRRREVRILVPGPLTCKIDNPERFYYRYLNLNFVEGIYNALTGERLLSGSDINRYGETSNDALLISHDDNYGLGYFENLTEECLLIKIQPYSGQPLNADLEYVEQNGAVENRDGVYYISLGPEKPWDVMYTTQSGQIVKIATGPNVTRSAIDPQFTDFDDPDQLAEYQALVNDRVDLVINTTVQSIESSCFPEWSNLKTVTLSGGGDVGNTAFAGLSLTEVTIGAGVRRLGNACFASNSQATYLFFEEGITEIGAAAFAGWGSCQYLQLPNSLTTIGQQAFAAWNAGRDLVLGSGITVLEGYIFPGFGQGMAQTLDLGSGVVEIRTQDFQAWSQAVELIIPDQVEYIGENAFHSWERCERLVIGPNVKYIGNYAFGDYRAITEFQFGSGEFIDQNAFINWYEYTGTLTIPSNTRTISTGAFMNWYACKGLSFEEGIEKIGFIDSSHADMVMVGDGTFAFLNWYAAETLHLPNSLKQTNASFINWWKCTNLHIGSGLTQIGGTADNPVSEFDVMGVNVETGVDYTIPDTVTEIGAIFSATPIRTLTLSKNLVKIGKIPTAPCPNDAPYSVYLRSANPPVVSPDAQLLASTSMMTVYVPDVEAYKNDPGWARFDTQTSETRFTLFEEWTPT